MGLDIYVGSLTRYYAGDWELIAQTAARELGMQLQVIRQQPDPPEAIRDPKQIRPAVLAWRDSLSIGLNDHLAAPLEWDESSDTLYFTDKPTWDCYGDLLLWAAYEEQPQLRRPEQHVVAWSTDSAYQLSSQTSSSSRYTHLYDVALWLPVTLRSLLSRRMLAVPRFSSDRAWRF